MKDNWLNLVSCDKDCETKFRNNNTSYIQMLQNLGIGISDIKTILAPSVSDMNIQQAYIQMVSDPVRAEVGTEY